MGLVKTRRLAAMQKQQKAKAAIRPLPKVMRSQNTNRRDISSRGSATIFRKENKHDRL